MRLIVNSDRVIAALIRDSKSRQIVLSGKFELVTRDFALSEIHEHEEEILRKGHFSKSQLESVLSILFSKLRMKASIHKSFRNSSLLNFV